MAADIVNLRQARKQKTRAEKERKAAENRAHFGRTKHEKTLTLALKDKADRTLDQGRLEKAPGPAE
ncbi:MAG: DUF4169 family protein [Rhizobiaceae bacterium]|nr:DUF4169 family protein [Rhizobiaceae bacterium]